jgi:hypothetical protein
MVQTISQPAQSCREPAAGVEAVAAAVAALADLYWVGPLCSLTEAQSLFIVLPALPVPGVAPVFWLQQASIHTQLTTQQQVNEMETSGQTQTVRDSLLPHRPRHIPILAALLPHLPTPIQADTSQPKAPYTYRKHSQQDCRAVYALAWDIWANTSSARLTPATQAPSHSHTCSAAAAVAHPHSS